MKRLIIIATALLLMTSLTQCKKEQIQANNEKTVDITLDIKRNGTSRMDVNTGTGEVTYVSGDIIYVVSGGECVGTLIYNGTNFDGSISNPTLGEPLYFYFLGNNTPIFNTDNTGCIVDISDQTNHLPVIECAPSNEIYVSGMTTFTAFLLNKCALVKFNVVTASEAATCITGFNNKVTIDFTDASFAYRKTNSGCITIPAGNGERWGILLPQEAMEAGGSGSAYSDDGEYIGICGAVPAIYENGFLTAGINVTITTEVYPNAIPVGAINGKFTINANGDQVYFSQGNLQYKASTGIWRFAEHQYDMIGDANSNIGQNYDGWIDLFGWGTSGWNCGNTYYRPYDKETGNNAYYYYGPLGYNDLIDNYANSDWGVYNIISNGGNQAGIWRTLTSTEFNYLINTRTNATSKRSIATINNIHGLILLPDSWNLPSGISFTSNASDWSTNTYTTTQWQQMENNGAVFLPAAGNRDYTLIGLYNNRGLYWSSNSWNGYGALALRFDLSTLDVYDHNYFRCAGLAIRLVQNY